MNRIRVSDILATIREDHELVAEQLSILKALEGSIADAEGRHLERVLELLRSASRFFQTKLFPHFEEEEHGMFLLFRDRLPRGSTLIYELEAEHEQMRKLSEQLREELSWMRHEKHRKPPILAELAQLCRRIADLLSRHAEREDQLVGQYLSSEKGFQSSCAVDSLPADLPSTP
jgi:hemerythrin-like domain-containing protein